MSRPILYTAEVDYDKEYQALFADWFSNRHAPDLIRAGFRAATSYRAVVGGLKVLNVYEVPDAGLFALPQYKGVLKNDPYADKVRGTSAEKMRAQTTYVQRTDTHEGMVLDADWISLLRFAAAEGEDAALIDWVRGDVLRQLAPLGVKRIRLGTRTPEPIGAGTHRPRCMVLAEWAVQPPDAGDLQPALASRFGGAVTEVEPYVGRRSYPWADAKAG